MTFVPTIFFSDLLTPAAISQSFGTRYCLPSRISPGFLHTSEALSSRKNFMTKNMAVLVASSQRLAGLAPQAQASAPEHCTLGTVSQDMKYRLTSGDHSLIQYTRMFGSMMSSFTRSRNPGISSSGMPAAASSFVVPPRNLR